MLANDVQAKCGGLAWCCRWSETRLRFYFNVNSSLLIKLMGFTMVKNVVELKPVCYMRNPHERLEQPLLTYQIILCFPPILSPVPHLLASILYFINDEEFLLVEY